MLHCFADLARSRVLSLFAIAISRSRHVCPRLNRGPNHTRVQHLACLNLHPGPPPSPYHNSVSSSQPPPTPILCRATASATVRLAFLPAYTQPLLRRISTNLRILAHVRAQILLYHFYREVENDHAGRDISGWCCVVVCSGFALRLSLLSSAAPLIVPDHLPQRPSEQSVELPCRGAGYAVVCQLVLMSSSRTWSTHYPLRLSVYLSTCLSVSLSARTRPRAASPHRVARRPPP